MSNIPYKRVLIKLSGEMLGGTQGQGLDVDAVNMIAAEIAAVHATGVEIGIVIGGGNFFRGSLASAFGMERASADYMGMLATCINALALQTVLENKCEIYTRVMTAIEMKELAEPYIRRKAMKHLAKGRIVIFAGGTGNPLFTTDTAASLRAQEVGAEMILKATKVDGIYDCDPTKHDNAVRYDELRYIDVISRKLEVMDATAITMCMEANLPIMVFKLDGEQSILKALHDHSRGTIVK